ncbi:hypothetical protein ACFX12_009137 [Malus domestica]
MSSDGDNLDEDDDSKSNRQLSDLVGPLRLRLRLLLARDSLTCISGSVFFLLQISTELKNLTDLQPQDGYDNPNYSYLFKRKCEWCGELSPRETFVSLNETITLPARCGDL